MALIAGVVCVNIKATAPLDEINDRFIKVDRQRRTAKAVADIAVFLYKGIADIIGAMYDNGPGTGQIIDPRLFAIQSHGISLVSCI